MAPISAIPARSGPALSEVAGRWCGEAMTRIARLKAFDWEASRQLLATWRRRFTGPRPQPPGLGERQFKAPSRHALDMIVFLGTLPLELRARYGLAFQRPESRCAYHDGKQHAAPDLRAPWCPSKTTPHW